MIFWLFSSRRRLWTVWKQICAFRAARNRVLRVCKPVINFCGNSYMPLSHSSWITVSLFSWTSPEMKTWTSVDSNWSNNNSDSLLVFQKACWTLRNIYYTQNKRFEQSSQYRKKLLKLRMIHYFAFYRNNNQFNEIDSLCEVVMDNKMRFAYCLQSLELKEIQWMSLFP